MFRKRQTDWLADWLADWLTDCMHACKRFKSRWYFSFSIFQLDTFSFRWIQNNNSLLFYALFTLQGGGGDNTTNTKNTKHLAQIVYKTINQSRTHHIKAVFQRTADHSEIFRLFTMTPYTFVALLVLCFCFLLGSGVEAQGSCPDVSQCLQTCLGTYVLLLLFKQ